MYVVHAIIIAVARILKVRLRQEKNTSLSSVTTRSYIIGARYASKKVYYSVPALSLLDFLLVVHHISYIFVYNEWNIQKY